MKLEVVQKQESIIVLKTEGKGNDRPDFVKVLVFQDRAVAKVYCQAHTKLDGKYYTQCEIIEEGIRYELDKEGNIPDMSSLR